MRNSDSCIFSANDMTRRLRTRWITASALLLGCIPLLLAGSASAHGEAGADDGGFRALLGGFEVIIASNFFHTLGAMMLFTGLVLLLYLLGREEVLDEGEDVLVPEIDGDEPLQNPAMRSASLLIWVGLAINIIAGLARLFEPGHPSLVAMFSDRWVSIMLFKHFFILVLSVTAVMATSSRLPLMRRRMLTRLSIAFVVIIGILGAAASTVAGG